MTAATSSLHFQISLEDWTIDNDHAKLKLVATVNPPDEFPAAKVVASVRNHSATIKCTDELKNLLESIDWTKKDIKLLKKYLKNEVTRCSQDSERLVNIYINAAPQPFSITKIIKRKDDV